MKSPCIGVCKMNAGICIGCFRTLSEIAQWREKTQDQKQLVVHKILGKENTHSCPDCNSPTFCDIKAGKDSCWCFDLNTRHLDKKHDHCLCRSCLAKSSILEEI